MIVNYIYSLSESSSLSSVTLTKEYSAKTILHLEKPLPSVTLAKEYSANILSVKCFFVEYFFDTQQRLCRVLFDIRQSLYRVSEKKYSTKKPFVAKMFAEYSLSGVAVGKFFTECKMSFAECLRHSAKNAIPVVSVTPHKDLPSAKGPLPSV